MKFSSPWFSMIAFYVVFVGGEFSYYYINGYAYPHIDLAFFDNVITFGTAAFLSLFLISHAKTSSPAHHCAPFPTQSSFGNDNCGLGPYRVQIGLLLSVVVLLLLGVKNGVNPIADPLGFRQVIQGGGNSYFLLLFLFFYKLYGVFYIEKIYLKEAKLRHHVFTGIVILFCLTSGFTSLFVHMFISGFIYLNLRYGFRVIRPSIVIGFMVLIISTPIYTVIRELKKNGVTIEMSVVYEHLEKMNLDPFKVLVDRFDYFDNFVVGAYYARLNQDYAKALDFFLQPLPRGMFPDKPYNFSTTMTGYVYPANLDIGVTANFGFINEFVLYFGDLGPLLAGIFLAVLTLFCYKQYLSAKTNGRTSAFYAVITLPYFMSFPIGYFNDMGLPALILNFIFWHAFVGRRYLGQRSKS